MKTYSWIFITIFPFSFLKAQNNPDSLIKKQRVKEVFIHQGDRVAGDAQYDINGNLSYFRYDNFGASTYLKVSTLNIYNKDQTLLQSKSTHSSFPNDTTIWNYRYDAKKNLLAIIDNKGHILINYSYDSLGRKVMESYLGPSGQTLSTTTSQYDEKGNKKEEIMKMGSFINRINITYYDSLKRKIKTESIENNKVRFACTDFYQANTNLLLKVIYDEDGSGTRLDGVEYKYDNKGRLIARLHFDLNNEKETITGEENFEYFENDLIKKYSENIFTANHIKRSFDYSYKFN